MRCFVIMGVAGCGKTSIGEALSKDGLLEFIDGDALHPAANLRKMSSGVPLNDADREPWLRLVGQRFAKSDGPIAIGCSALKRHYRDLITKSAGEPVGFAHLSAPIEVIAKRMAARTGHFMPLTLLESQFADLEPLAPDELGQDINIATSFRHVVSAVRSYLEDQLP